MKKRFLFLFFIIPLINNAQFVTTLTASGVFAGGSSDGVGVSARFQYPSGICSDNNGNLYVADTNNHKIRKLALNTGMVTTIAGSVAGYNDGVGISAQFYQPNGICYDGVENLYIADTRNHKIRKLNLNTNLVTTITGGAFGFNDGNLNDSKFNNPQGICYVNNFIYIADTYNNKIRKIDLINGLVSTLAGGLMGYLDGIGPSVKFSNPTGICFDGLEYIYICDSSNFKVRKVNINTNLVTTVAGGSQGYQDGNLNEARFVTPKGITYDLLGFLYVVDMNNNRIRKIDLNQNLVSTLAGAGFGTADGPALSAQFYSPSFITLVDNNLYLTDASNNSIRKISDIYLGVNNYELADFKIYPNPAREIINITLQENLQLEKVNIYNTLGQLIKTEKNSSINVSSLSKGSYYFEVITNQGKATKTIVVE